MVTHVLLDGDGVLQRHPRGWVEAAEAYVGDRAAAFFVEVTEQERACLTGGHDFVPLLADALVRYGVQAPVDEVYAEVWLTIETVPTTVALVHELRRLGLGVHLGTNQQAGRAAYMRTALGYDDLFDESFYSCELGAAKPTVAFFAAVVDRLGTTAPEVLFVDDHEPHVLAARELGLAAERWHHADGLPRLHALLAGHGIVAGSAPPSR